MVENWICIRRFLISIEDGCHNFNLGVWQTLRGTTKCHFQGEGNCMFPSKNMPTSKDRKWKEGSGLGECFMTHAKFFQPQHSQVNFHFWSWLSPMDVLKFWV